MYGIDFRNPWIVQADGARRALPAWSSAMLATAGAALFVIGGRALAGGLTGRLTFGAPDGFGRRLAETAMFYACVFAPFYLAAIGFTRLVERRPAVRGWPPLPALAVGLAVGLGGLSLAIGVAGAAGVLRPGGGAPTGAQAGAGAAAMLALVAVQAGAEEVFFRGWLQPRLCARWGPWIGLGAGAAVFAVAHLAGAAWSAAALANVLLAGLLFGALALRTGGLWAPFGAHLGWNWAEASVFGAEPNPGLNPLGALFDVDLAGPRLLSGGTEGLNGSLITTVVLAALAAALALPRGRAPD